MLRTGCLFFASLALAYAAGCKSSSETVPPGTTTSTTATSGGGGSGTGGQNLGGEPSWIVQTGSGGCDAIEYAPPVVSSSHVEECSVVEYLSNPPTSGNHYPRWATFKTYTEPVPRGYLVHAMEHGAVVLGYNCPSGCADEVAAMQAFVDALEPDPKCLAPLRTRLIIAPDPELDVPFAAATWGHMIKAQCFDAAIVGAFLEDHYPAGPEDACGPGFDPTDPLERVPPDCGE